MVLAQKEQIPTEEISPETDVRKGSLTSVKGNNRDQLWAMIRRIRAQLKDLETSISINKRDIARIERSINRGKEKNLETSTIENPQDANLLNPILFG